MKYHEATMNQTIINFLTYLLWQCINVLNVVLKKNLDVNQENVLNVKKLTPLKKNDDVADEVVVNNNY